MVPTRRKNIEEGRGSFGERIKLLKYMYLQAKKATKEKGRGRKLIESNRRNKLRRPLSAEETLYILCRLIYLWVSTKDDSCIGHSSLFHGHVITLNS